MTRRRFTVVAGAGDEGERLDRVIASHLAREGVSRSLATRLCDDGLALMGGKPAKPSQRVRAGLSVSVEVPPPEAPTAEPQDIPLRVLFEDAAVLVVDKPAGLVVHPAKGHANGTLVNAVLFHLGAAGRALLEAKASEAPEVEAGEGDDEGPDEDEAFEEDPLRPGIVHRLDRDTSGVLVVAKTPAARESLREQFRVHSTEREYYALVEGVVGERTFETKYGRHPKDRKKFSSRVREGRTAVTHVRTLETFAKGRASLVACRLETGRTHQIRVHLSEHGFPLLGDVMYGRTPVHAPLRPVATALGRQALHARLLGFEHPSTHELVRFESEPPADFAAALAALRAL